MQTITLIARRLVIAAVSIFLTTAPLIAFQPPDGQGEFVPVTELPAGDRMPAAPLLITAYAFVWVALLIYVWSIWRRLGKVEGEIRAIANRPSRPGTAR
jgi:CcmD family protein